MYRSDILARYTYNISDRNGDGKTRFENSKTQGMEFQGTLNADGSYNWGEPVLRGGTTTAHLDDGSSVNLAIVPFSDKGVTRYEHILTISVQPQSFYFGTEVKLDSLLFNDIQLTHRTVRSYEGDIGDFWGVAKQMMSSALHAILRADMYGGSVLSNGVHPSTQYEYHDPINNFFYRYQGSVSNDEYHARLYDEKFLGNVVADLGSGDDIFTGSDRTDIAYGGDGNDILKPYYNSVYYGSRRPVLNKDLSYGDILDGGAGNDIIYGQIGGTLIGGAGIDKLIFRFDSTAPAFNFKLTGQQNAEVIIGASTKISGFEIFDLSLAGGKNILDARGFKKDGLDGPSLRTVVNSGGSTDGQNDRLFIDHLTSLEHTFNGFESVSMDFSKAAHAVEVTVGSVNSYWVRHYNGPNQTATSSPAQHGYAFTINGTRFADEFDGSRKVDVLRGNDGDDTLKGYDGDDNLAGGGGNDFLDGGLGADVMAGGTGNDVFLVDNARDRVSDVLAGGRDIVKASVSFTLPDHVDNLALSGLRNLSGTGNALANVITGNSGDNTLDGRGGADTLEGRNGNDTYIVDNAGDRVIETYGLDTVLSSVSYVLTAGVEDLTLLGTANLKGTGNGLRNVLKGNTGANTLNGADENDTLMGMGGNDRLTGGIHADRLYGGTGADTFAFLSAKDSYGSSNRDTIMDFSRSQGDKIDLKSIDANSLVAGNQAFSFVGTAAFTKQAGQLRYEIVSGKTNIYADLSGDGSVDLAIVLNSSIALKTTDFIL